VFEIIQFSIVKMETTLFKWIKPSEVLVILLSLIWKLVNEIFYQLFHLSLIKVLFSEFKTKKVMLFNFSDTGSIIYVLSNKIKDSSAIVISYNLIVSN